MKFVPKGLTRVSSRSMLKLSAASPTILVVAGVVGFGATAVLAAKASRNMDPVLDEHKQARATIGYVGHSKTQQKELVRLYSHTGLEMAKVYSPAIVVGTLSTASILYGHQVLRGRHMASLAAYTGLVEQFQAYRGRVRKTLGEDVERGIFEGAHGEWVEDPDHKGEHKLVPKYDALEQASYLRPWFDESNVNWTRNAEANYLFLKGVQSHMNNLLQIRGHVFLNDVYDSLRIPRTNEGQVAGWVYDSKNGKDSFVDFGFMASNDPQAIAFCNFAEKSVRLNFNIDGNIYGLI